jgi:Zn-dependent protease with chaperone function
MNALAAPKSPMQNRLEGFALTAIFQGFPNFATVALLLKLAHREIAGGPVFLALAASILYGVLTPWLATKFPKLSRHSYEPLFFDASLSFAEKLSQWRAQPMASLQLVFEVMTLSVLAVGVAGMG